jgi:starch phosphorylase
LSLLESSVVPLFYDRDVFGVPRGWLAKLRASMCELTPRFSANRMLSDYIERLYLPASRTAARRVLDRDKEARSLAAFVVRLRQRWGEVRIGKMTLARTATLWQCEVPVELGPFEPADVRVELYADATATHPRRSFALSWAGTLTQPPGAHRFAAAVALVGPETDYTPRVSAWHPAAITPTELNFIRWP